MTEEIMPKIEGQNALCERGCPQWSGDSDGDGECYITDQLNPKYCVPWYRSEVERLNFIAECGTVLIECRNCKDGCRWTFK
jgi:hypothetical protein